MKSMTYQVTGMTCEHCVRAVTGELAGVPGVGAVTVALVPGGESAVTVTSDAPLSPEVVSAALDEAGPYHLSAPNHLSAPSDAAAPPPFQPARLR
ncbi:MAG: heavy-metal-associated domain-containing protein [Trebonia sp.]